ncbi:hypothetical protein QWJ34_15710 [Saccharibacillus sp. CPCC 101409]|uniref:hypothetical protein n=1 Tax=Saccharibacillus sp. CPCC 101409 TaxID=3058041 RepID=UPI00267202D1|nr:hypothetical protein [Saccharibacillus sp. CPCC 101409]MDO3411212.1 hypothetical protein [Saccharibacillus sp. CPCC 101409]
MRLRTELEPRSGGAAARIEDITRDELIEIVRRIQEPERAVAAGPEEAETPAEQPDAGELRDFYLELLQANVTMPGVSDLIFRDDLDAEEVVDRALAYRPIILPPG